MKRHLRNRNILISGASIAGPALAYWLRQYGFNPTIVERAREVKVGGYKIDIRGKAVDVVKRMGIYDQIRGASVDMIGASFVNDEGKKIVELPADLLGMREGEDTELMRGDLARILYQITRNDCEYLFGDSIESVRQDEYGVEVKFENAKSPRKFDLLVGADGAHSNVRSLVFGDESKVVHDLGGYHFAIFSIENYLGLDRHEVFYFKVNKAVNVYRTKQDENAKALFLFRNPGLKYDYRNIEQQKKILVDTYAGLRWEVPTLLKSALKAPDFYFDSINQIRMNQWSSGRTALIGDSAYAPSLVTGQGTSMALIGAYVLAGELSAANGDYQKAFPEFEAEVRSYIEKNQALGRFADQVIPKSAFELRLQTMIVKLLSYLPLSKLVTRKMRNQIRQAANAINLKSY